MADLLDLDADRLGHWLFARCVEEWLDKPHLRRPALELAKNGLGGLPELG